MFHYRYDPIHAFAVMVLAPPASETDIEQYVACVKTLDAAAANRKGSALVLVLVSGYPLPDGPTRKRGVDARKDMKARPVVAVVTTNPLLRAALAAARWISPPPYEQSVSATFEEAVQFIESKRGSTLRLLDRMYEETTSEMATRKSPRAR
jgi:hypothetical protein